LYFLQQVGLHILNLRIIPKLLQGEELSSELQALAKSDAFKSLSDKFSQTVQQLGQGNKTEVLKQQAGANLSKLVQKLEQLRVNSTQ